MSNSRDVSGPVRGIVMLAALIMLALVLFCGCQMMGGVPDLG